MIIYCVCKERVKREEIQQIIAGRKVVCVHVSRQQCQGHLHVAFCDWLDSAGRWVGVPVSYCHIVSFCDLQLQQLQFLYYLQEERWSSILSACMLLFAVTGKPCSENKFECNFILGIGILYGFAFVKRSWLATSGSLQWKPVVLRLPSPFYAIF